MSDPARRDFLAVSGSIAGLFTIDEDGDGDILDDLLGLDNETTSDSSDSLANESTPNQLVLPVLDTAPTDEEYDAGEVAVYVKNGVVYKRPHGGTEAQLGTDEGPSEPSLSSFTVN